MRNVNVARKARLAVACLLGATALTPFGAAAQTWLGATSNYNTASNWDPASVPGGTAIFGATGASTVNLAGGVVGTFQFDSLAQAYTFSGGMIFNGSGIVNNSSNVQTFTGGTYFFNNSATAGNATFSLAGGVALALQGSSTAGTAIINLDNSYLAVNGSGATFGNAKITASNGSSVYITTGSGGQAELTLVGATSQLILQIDGGIGSIAGTEGQVNTNFRQLTVGGNNLSTSYGGSIAGINGSIVKVGTGTWTLSGSNSYTAGTTINAGTISIAANNNLGDASGSLAFGGGTLQTTADISMSRATARRRG